MTPRSHRHAIVASFFYVAALLSIPSPARAEDIDIFSINSAIAGQRPNVLIILDSSANWAATDSVAGGKKYQHVAAAMVSTIGGLTDQFNVGLMMMAETGNPNDNIDGAAMRAGVRQMTTANRQKIVDFFATVDADFDKSNNTSMGMAFYEAYLYFTGQTGFGGIGKAKRDYGGNSWANAGASQQGAPAAMQAAVNAIYNTTPNALTNSASTVYNSPMTDACQKNFIIYIANGAVSDPNSSNSTATTKLAAVGGAGATDTILFTQDTGDQGNISDEWTRWLANNDVSTALTGTQKIITYTVEVNPLTNTQGRNNTQLLKSVGNKSTGNGGYFGVSSAGGGAQIADALNQIFAEILAVNSVFASSTLPVSVNVRGSFLNQVYMGVFRPDGNSSPRWPGNVKQYKLALNANNDVFLADKNGVAVENNITGFIADSAASFWSTTSTFWDNTYYPDTVAQPPLTPTTSDIPDGSFVEKGGAAQHLRTTHATDVTTRKLYTCISCAADSVLSDGTNNFNTANASLTATLLGISGTKSVSSLTRSGNTVTATSTAHGFTSGQTITMAGANEAQYNGLTNITVVDANTFTYSITELPVSPATAATAQTLTAAKGSSAQTVNSITLSGSTATATTPVAHGYANGASVTISGATQTEYNGTYTIATSGPASTTFTYTVAAGPITPATTPGNISVLQGGGATVSSAISTITRTGNRVDIATTSNVLSGGGPPTCSAVTITGAVPATYNVTSRSPCVRDGNRALHFDLLASELTPTSPATTLTSLTSSSAVSRTISSMTRPTGSGTVTVITSVAHTFSTGDTIAISGASDSIYNGNFVIAGAVGSTFTFTVTPQPTTPATGTITATGSASITRDDLINWARGENVKLDDNPTPTATRVRGYLHGDVLHSRPAVINYNRAGQPLDRDIVVYYGSNAGVIHAVKGGQDDLDGDEKWGFIPTEFYTGFARLYNESPIISTNNPRTYFADGPISVDAVFVNDSATPPVPRLEGTGARAQLYIGMRRGGRYYYSLNVTSPDAPVYKWKIANTTTGFAELGQSWSEAKVQKVRIGTCPGGADAQGNCKVLVFGAGYDTAANDPTTQGTATMGRGIFVVDAITGALIWHTSPTAAGSVTMPAGATYLQTSGMTYAIAADMAVINSDSDGQNLADRIYATDTGGNIWRVNISDANPANWAVAKVAALGGSGVNARKFLFAPSVVPFDNNYDSILVGTGDREHPFDTTINNRYYMIKDAHGINTLLATPVTEASLCDLTSNNIQSGSAVAAQADRDCLATSSGWFIRLATGEKTVTGATTIAGTTIFGTNTPASVATPGSCTGSLGEARLYAVDFKDATATIDFNGDGVLSGSERATTLAGGGLPPTPIPFNTPVDGPGGGPPQNVIGGLSGPNVITPTGAALGQRYRVFWNLQVDN